MCMCCNLVWDSNQWQLTSALTLLCTVMGHLLKSTVATSITFSTWHLAPCPVSLKGSVMPLKLLWCICLIKREEVLPAESPPTLPWLTKLQYWPYPCRQGDKQRTSMEGKVVMKKDRPESRLTVCSRVWDVFLTHCPFRVSLGRRPTQLLL